MDFKSDPILNVVVYIYFLILFYFYIFKLCFKMNHTLVKKKLEVSKDNRDLSG